MVKFIADCMLGKLARWLRISGYDTLYIRYLSDSKIIALARFEKRFVLTRDLEMRHLEPNLVYLVKSLSIQEQLQEVLERFKLSPKLNESRCPHCNEILLPINREQAKKYVPLFVYQSFNKFTQCPSCKKVYWPGTHWQKITRLCQCATNKAK
ncbi:MAG: Mut7-C RNAse domain-containing protein [Candidatus Atribacteria bacterium]|nr:Mut7-C RNAse domain-containing protein [Candidatus Atribacteria bacterium]MCD6350027.1 Mut7-C RNAse domain-containing protein [Candidatus Atribacteria bacterium]